MQPRAHAVPGTRARCLAGLGGRPEAGRRRCFCHLEVSSVSRAEPTSPPLSSTTRVWHGGGFRTSQAQGGTRLSDNLQLRQRQPCVRLTYRRVLSVTGEHTTASD